MDNLKWLFSYTLQLFSLPISLYGYTFNFFQILVFGALCTLLIIFVRGLFN